MEEMGFVVLCQLDSGLEFLKIGVEVRTLNSDYV